MSRISPIPIRTRAAEATARSPWRRRAGIMLSLLAVAALASLAFHYFFPSPEERRAELVVSGNWQDLVPDSDMAIRAEIYRESLAAGAALSDWPATPQALIADFWGAASRKDFDRMALLCPGSLAADYRTYYDRWTPSPARAIGHPQRDSRAEGVTLYPVRLDFPFFPNKTVKIAVRRLDDERLIIDGRYSIWW